MEYFTTREIAIGIWILVFVAFCCAAKGMRSTVKNALIDIAKTLKFKYIILPFILLLLYGAFWIYVFQKTILWNNTFIKDILIWVLFAGIPLCFNAVSNDTKPDYFKRALLDAIKVTIIVEFIVSTYTFHLVVELILVPIIVFCVLGSTISKDEKTKKFYEYLTTIIGVIIIIISVVFAIQQYEDFGQIKTWVSFFIPIVLTLLFLPIAYIFAVFSQYEQIMIKLKILIPDDVKLRRKRFAYILGTLGLSIKKLIAFRSKSFSRLYINLSDDEFKTVVNDFK